jgi:hypothetical protein
MHQAGLALTGSMTYLYIVYVPDTHVLLAYTLTKEVQCQSSVAKLQFFFCCQLQYVPWRVRSVRLKKLKCAERGLGVAPTLRSGGQPVRTRFRLSSRKWDRLDVLQSQLSTRLQRTGNMLTDGEISW